MNREPGFSDYVFGLLMMSVGGAMARLNMGQSFGDVMGRFVGTMVVGVALMALVRWLSRFRIVRKERVQP